MNWLWPFIWALAPTVGLLFLFYHIMKNILEGDRRERIAQAAWEREHPHDTLAPDRVEKSN